jgi:transcriptional regulator with XRE-family HTH domain
MDKKRMQLRLRDIRVERGLTQRQVAERAGYSVSYITEVENGTKQVNARMLDQLSAALTLLGQPNGYPTVTPASLILDETDPELAALARQISDLSPEQKDAVIRLVRAFHKSPPAR